ncbi:MAG: trehalose operon repressor [Amphibacillus sp.]|uniref:Trehalose operon repressor n=1 Tax=Amphibacillus xylanus (strain ATCC 51415 / DSM 6626 / JCM 7361 / LMG 17667 / NBRC 15112 / Ep01) TaxID=698758 RepID=K0J814_AMPXN|nr:trehalose operon repressor [Amphibacillus xylanus]NMA90803.1 trehalose operon repressor [Amphibacillus sp.]BAM48323.1 trehalose operon transcriptional repressor [Amphibacillus xylanus NBRC 15112]
MKRKYDLIYQSLVERIEREEWEVGELLPSENELKDAYQTSRETIRKALNLLSQKGYIQKVRGKGSVLIERNKFDFPVSGLVSFKEIIEKMDLDVKTHVEELELVKADQFLQDRLQIDKDDKVWRIIRVREFSGERVILDKDFLIADRVPDLTVDICQDSIYAYIEKELGLTISFAKKEITVEEPTEEDERLLDLEGYSHVVLIKNYVYLDDATLFQYTESRHRPDKFRFVDFARRLN